MKVYFEDRYEKRHLIAEVESTAEVMQQIRKFIEEKNPNFKIYYTRTWTNDDGDIIYDVGSHSEFFLIRD